jgi:hypothetical protein
MVCGDSLTHRRNASAFPGSQFNRVSRNEYVVGDSNAQDSIQAVAPCLAGSALDGIDQNVARARPMQRVSSRLCKISVGI